MTSPTSQPDLLLAQTTHWYQRDSETFVSCVFDSRDPDGAFEEQEVHRATLAQLHPELPDLMEAMISYKRHQKEEALGKKGLGNAFDSIFSPRAPLGVSGKNVRETLRLNQGNVIDFTDTEGRQNTVTLANLLSQDRPAFVRLTGTTVETQQACIDGRDLRFVTASRRLPHMIYLSELDGKYPGWRERWVVAQSLHDVMDDVVSQVFVIPVLPTVSPLMNGLSFD